MTSIDQAYTGETIIHSDGREYAVLDISKLSFTGPDVQLAKRTAPVRVRVANATDVIRTHPGAIDENKPYKAKVGELIFYDKLPAGGEEAYVPRDPQGKSIGWEILEKDYAYVGGDRNGEGAYYRPVGNPYPILHEAIARPSCIKNAYGPDDHAFFTPGASLKCDGDRISGIEKGVFDFAWHLMNERKRRNEEKPRSL